jgi:filamentous hemagglutinin family protein
MIMPTAPFRLRPIVCFCLMALPALARAQTAPGALPTNGTVASGSVTLHQDANTLRVNQASDKAIVNWQTFNIGRDAAVQFVQPGAGSAILNRVASGPSDIAGKLTSNGRVYLVNPNGVLFGASARVDVGSLVVAAGTVSDSSFLSGAPRVASRGAVANAGTLNAADGGSVVLAGSSVANSGSINAPHGAITLAAGDAVRINLSDDGLIQAQVTLAAPHAPVTNSGTLSSEGGRIALAASASAGGAGGLVIDSGIVRAGAVRTHGGTVSLIGGEVQASGSIDVSSNEGAAGSVGIFGDLQVGSVRFNGSIDARGATAGGMVETSAARVQAGPAARVATLASNGHQGRHGTWLIDPQDYTIGNAPGDDISGASLSANLNQGNVTIQSVTGARSGAGDIHVNAPVSWGADTTLTLTAENSILFASGAITDPRNPNGAAQANLTATGNGAGLVMNFGNDYKLGENKLTFSGATPHVTMNGVQFTVINEASPEALDITARINLGGNFVLTSDIDASDLAFDDNGQGWLPLGTVTAPFSGQLHGFGHVISNLPINRPNNTVGLFGVLTGTVRDIGLLDPDIVGRDAGALAGNLRGDNALVRNTWVAGGSVSGNAAGGLVGSMFNSSLDSQRTVIDSSYTSGVVVNGATEGSGLVGRMNIFGSGTIANSFYNAGDPLYSETALGPGAVLDDQFHAWLAGGRTLRIADYSASLPYDAQTDSYGLGTLQGMRDLLGFANAGIKLRLTNDLDLGEEIALYLPTFNGQLDGANHTISNLTIDTVDSVSYTGLVGVNSGTIRNLNLANARIDGQTVGGIAGINLGTIQNVSVSGALSGNSTAGGLVGVQLPNGALLDSVSTASILGTSSFGGIIGDFEGGIVRNSHYNADAVLVNGATSSLSVGGLRGAQYADWMANGRRLDIASYANVLPRDPASGAYLVSSVAGMNALLGFADDPALNFRLNANIDLAPAPGLFLPYLMGTLDGNGHQVSNLNLNAPEQQYLGLVGLNFGTVRNLGVTNAAVNGLYYAGALVGRNEPGARIETSVASGAVAADFGAGGLAGANFGDISNSYSSASVNVGSASQGRQGGGLVGLNVGTISNSLATGAISGGGDSGSGSGGLVGDTGGSGGGTVTNSFWNIDTSGTTASAGGTGKTTAELQSLATYTGWDFAHTWRMVDGTVSLRPFTAGQYDLVVDALDLNRVYGSGPVAPGSLSVAFAGFQGGDSQAQLTGQLGYSGDAVNAINAGSYSVLPGGLASSKYDIVYLPGTVTIDRAPLVLSADNKSMRLNDPLPILTWSASGLQYADSPSLVTGVNLSTNPGGVGQHPILISGGDAGPNYRVSTVNGLLSVDEAPAPIVPPAPVETPVEVQSLALAPAALALPRVPEATAAGSVSLAASITNGATPQRKELFLQAGDAITRNPNIATLKNCGEDELGDCIARPRVNYKAQVSEDTGGAAPTMHIKRKLALVIGNNDYHSPLAPLEGAGRDARSIAALLQQQGYQVDHLHDANRSSMIASLNRLILTAEPDDSVLVFYAGHGYIHPGSSVGYWIPTDANVDDPRGWLSNIDIARFMANIPARQQLLVSDSCFSGSLTREGVAAEQRTGLNRNAILMRRSVVALSSGGEEVVADSTLDGHSPFTYYLLRQLQEAKGEIPARDMLLSIRDKVTNNAGQVPSYGIIISSGHASGGEYLLNPKTN